MGIFRSGDGTPSKVSEQACSNSYVDPDTVIRSIWSGTSIPSRVQKEVGIFLQDSAIPNVGKGVFCLGHVKAGGLIFKIKQPPMCHVNDPTQGIPSCDNCFATLTPPKAESTVYNICGGCRVVRYCDKECQRAAWRHHHKYECLTFADIRKTDEGQQQESSSSIIFNHNVRYIIRLVQLHRNGIIGEGTETQWAEFQCLPTGETWRRATDKELVHKAEELSKRLKGLIDTPLSLDEITKQQLAMSYNWKVLLIPTLTRRVHWSGPGTVAVIHVGLHVEPFISTIQRSCDGNVWFIFVGDELHARATRDIEAGSEILVTLPRSFDYEERTMHLKTLWNKSCYCKLCVDGPIGPTGELRQRIFDTIINDSGDRNATDIKSILNEMQASGFGYGADLMHYVYAATLGASVDTRQTAEALKSALTLYYLVEPNMKPLLSEEFRVCTLYHLIELSQPCEENTGLDPIPLQLREVLRALHLHWTQAQLIRGEKMLGKDNSVIRQERLTFATRLRRAEQDFETGAKNYLFLSTETEEERLRLVVLLNGVLRWAGIPPLAEEQLLTI